MKIIGLIGSPRQQGNTSHLVNTMLQQAAALGAETKLYQLGQLDIQPCKSCYACNTQENCTLDDDAQSILREIAAADAIVLGTPIYMWQMSGQLNLLVDRMFSFLRPDFSSKLAPGKKVALAVTPGQEAPTVFQAYFDSVGQVLDLLGFGEHRMVTAIGVYEPDDVLQQADTLEEARALGVWLSQKSDKSSLHQAV